MVPGVDIDDEEFFFPGNSSTHMGELPLVILFGLRGPVQD